MRYNNTPRGIFYLLHDFNGFCDSTYLINLYMYRISVKKIVENV